MTEHPYERGFWSGLTLATVALVTSAIAWPQTLEIARETVGITAAHAEAPAPANPSPSCFGLTVAERIQVEDTQDKLAAMKLPVTQQARPKPAPKKAKPTETVTVKLSPARQEALGDDDRRALAAAGLL